MDRAIVDLINNGIASGDVANRILRQGMNPANYRPYIGEDGRTYITVHIGGDKKKPENYKAIPLNNANAVLRPTEWKALDAVVLGISDTRLNGINDLITNNLVYNLGNAMGTTILETHDISDAMEAELTMDGISRGKGDRVEFGVNYLPIPIIHSDYEINMRVLEASRNMGNSLDMVEAERAARKVSEKLEAMLFTNTTYAKGGGTIYSYLNHPSRNLLTLSAAWDASGVTGADIINDVKAMKQKSINARHYGPWMIYIPTDYETVLDGDYDTATPGTTIRERIMKIEGIKGIKVNDTLAADNIVMVQMTSDVVRLVRGLPIQNVQWKTEGDFVNKFKVLTIQVPQIRADHDGRSGIVHASL